MPILFTNDVGTFFEPSLLLLIKRKRNDRILRILKNVNLRQLNDSEETTLLHFAAKHGNKNFCKHLIGLGLVVDVQNRFGETPLMLGVEADQQETVDVLLEADADPFLPDIGGHCALGRVIGNRDNVTKYILNLILVKVTVASSGSSVHVKSPRFHLDCPLYDFISMKNAGITRILLNKGSPVDAESSSNETALHKAAKQLDLENVRVLLEYKANVNAKNRDGQTPLACIPINYQEDQTQAFEIVKVLINAGAVLVDHESRKVMAERLLLFGNIKIVRALLERKIDLQFRNEEGDAILHTLSKNRQADILKQVQDSELAVNICTEDGLTMLHFAAFGAKLGTIQYLLDKGADIDILDQWNKTPLCRLVGTEMPYKKYDKRFYEFLDCIDILLEHGARPQLCTNKFACFSSIEDKFILLSEPVIAHLALLELSGQVLEEQMKEKINSCPAYKTIYEMKKVQLEEMTRTKLIKSISLIDFLIASEERMSQYARDPGLISNLSVIMKAYCRLDLHYHRKLQKKFLKVTRLAEMRRRLVIVISDLFIKLCHSSIYNIAKKVVDYLDDQELIQILPVVQ